MAQNRRVVLTIIEEKVEIICLIGDNERSTYMSGYLFIYFFLFKVFGIQTQVQKQKVS